MKNKKWVFWLAGSILAGVVALGIFSSSVLPQQKKDLSEFVPGQKIEVSVKETKEDSDFAAKNYPDHCDWEPLDRVVDGDTIVIGEKVSVRFIGIDTPETVHPTKPVQPWGPEASAKTKEFLSGDEKVCLISDELNDKLDKYGRRLAYVFSQEGVDVNAELVKLGLARGYFSFPFSRKDEFKKYEDGAKTAKVGVWSGESK